MSRPFGGKNKSDVEKIEVEIEKPTEKLQADDDSVLKTDLTFKMPDGT